MCIPHTLYNIYLNNTPSLQRMSTLYPTYAIYVYSPFPDNTPPLYTIGLPFPVCTHFTTHAQTVPNFYSTSQGIQFIPSSKHIFYIYTLTARQYPIFTASRVQNEAHLITPSKFSLHPMLSVYPIFTTYVMIASHTASVQKVSIANDLFI